MEQSDGKWKKHAFEGPVRKSSISKRLSEGRYYVLLSHKRDELYTRGVSFSVNEIEPCNCEGGDRRREYTRSGHLCLALLEAMMNARVILRHWKGSDGTMYHTCFVGPLNEQQQQVCEQEIIELGIVEYTKLFSSLRSDIAQLK